MRQLYLPLILIALYTSGATLSNGQNSSVAEIGITGYPNAEELPQTRESMWQKRAPSWLAIRVLHTSDSIKQVAKYFKTHPHKSKTSTQSGPMLSSLLRANWEIRELDTRFAPKIFDIDYGSAAMTRQVETTFGVIPLEDSIVRVHLKSAVISRNGKSIAGTLIILIRERLGEDYKNEVGRASADEKGYSGREVTQKVWIRSKPEPQNFSPGRTGTVILRALFHATGNVTNIRLIQDVPGATEAAVDAARKIKFIPAIKDGQYVSQYVQLEYNFNF